jgi:predicted DNA-binding protein
MDGGEGCLGFIKIKQGNGKNEARERAYQNVRHSDKMSDMTKGTTKHGAKELRISIRLTADLRRRIDAAAAKSGKRESVIVREALERQLAPARPAQSAYDLAVKAGIIGIAHGNSSDLSTNPRHFEGFGES